jgi:antitoxin (DNA-binding transcriptional repressor) of toxin-antitoxin stability system
MRTTVHAAKTQLSRLIEKARSGEEVIIARGDTPVVRLVALTERPRVRHFGAMKGRARAGDAFFEPLPDAELRAWEK